MRQIRNPAPVSALTNPAPTKEGRVPASSSQAGLSKVRPGQGPAKRRAATAAKARPTKRDATSGNANNPITLSGKRIINRIICKRFLWRADRANAAFPGTQNRQAKRGKAKRRRGASAIVNEPKRRAEAKGKTATSTYCTTSRAPGASVSGRWKPVSKSGRERCSAKADICDERTAEIASVGIRRRMLPGGGFQQIPLARGDAADGVGRDS